MKNNRNRRYHEAGASSSREWQDAPGLSEEERQIAETLKAAAEAMLAIPEKEQTRLPNPDKFSDPLGFLANAYFGGEAWRTGLNEITINAGSGAFGYNRNYAKTLTGEELTAYVSTMQQRFDRAVDYLKKLGFEVKVIPLTER